ncbi:Spy/CpxP family protein refolding chaperone [Ferribacterium limneticum]|uniref:Spy/CpxP family protein refolding chaperone n=1 Tax=Ferribacterium limneticum TaxID=76259 RepID=UPI001CF90D81|nr:Spy/CpxP family protein refolding chaperone [Ferribacterium limneticum]UCV22687.1 Spy/CpxP family protein refolding chaperone [Ferribacterium limneticum]
MNFPKLSLKRFLVAAAISLVVPLAALGVGQRVGSCGAGPATESGKMPPYLRQLDLSEAQRDRVFEIMHGQAPAMRVKVKAVRNAEESLRRLVLSTEYTEPKARALSDDAAKATAELALARAMAERQVYEVLSAEQRSQLAKLKAAGKVPMDGRGGERRPPPGD